MNYTVIYHDNEDYDLDNCITTEQCDCCKVVTRVQCLPAEYNAGEMFTANLCAGCLEALALGLREED